MHFRIRRKPDERFRFLGDEDYQRLFVKLDQLISVGVNKFGLLMDDIDYQLSPKDKLVFDRPGIAHAHLANRINKYLSERLVNHTLVLCPTEYSQIGSTQYRNDLKELLDKNIYIFWTGDNVCAEAITERDINRRAPLTTANFSFGIISPCPTSPTAFASISRRLETALLIWAITRSVI